MHSCSLAEAHIPSPWLQVGVESARHGMFGPVFGLRPPGWCHTICGCRSGGNQISAGSASLGPYFTGGACAAHVWAEICFWGGRLDNFGVISGKPSNMTGKLLTS